MVIVGSITGNDNTVGGGLVYPVADLGAFSSMHALTQTDFILLRLGTLKGLKAGAKAPIAMIDGLPFNGAKAYKDRCVH
jgi:hypothetical protein